jgi:hypothetical protein
MLSLAECPIQTVPEPGGEGGSTSSLPTWLQSLNVSITRLNSWAEVDKISQFPGLSDLRIQVTSTPPPPPPPPPFPAETEASWASLKKPQMFSEWVLFVSKALGYGGCRSRSLAVYL